MSWSADQQRRKKDGRDVFLPSINDCLWYEEGATWHRPGPRGEKRPYPRRACRRRLNRPRGSSKGKGSTTSSLEIKKSGRLKVGKDTSGRRRNHRSRSHPAQKNNEGLPSGREKTLASLQNLGGGVGGGEGRKDDFGPIGKKSRETGGTTQLLGGSASPKKGQISLKWVSFFEIRKQQQRVLEKSRMAGFHN